MEPDVINIDYNVKPSIIKDTIDIPIQGGLNPKILLQNRDIVKNEVTKYLKTFIKESQSHTLEHLIIKTSNALEKKFKIKKVKITINKTAVAKKYGAEVIENNKVNELKQRVDGCWEVHTKKGTIIAEHVVNAGGLWAKQVGQMAGLNLPISPLKHHYLVTETIPTIEAMDFEVPMTVDLEGFTYMRQWDKGILVGIYEIDHEHWAIDGAPWDFGMELFKEDFDRIENELALSFERYPDLKNVGIKMNFKQVDGSAKFSKTMKKEYEVTGQGWTGGFFPSPEGMMHGKYADEVEVTNITSMSYPELDKLIETYNAEWDAKKRIPLAHQIDSIAVNSFHYALGWTSPYGARMLYWY